MTLWTSPASRNVYYPCGMVLAGQLSAGPAILFPSTALLQLGCPHKHTWSNYTWSWTPLPAARSCLCPACTIPALLSGPSLQERQLIPLSSQAGEQEQLHPFWKARAWSCFQHPPRSLLGVSCQLKLLLSLLLSPYIPPILGPGSRYSFMWALQHCSFSPPRLPSSKRSESTQNKPLQPHQTGYRQS